MNEQGGLKMAVEKQSFDSLVESLGLSQSDRKSLPVLLKNVRHEVIGALEELKTITTHDDNLEKQYKETVEQNLKLASSLDRAKREIRHLKGKLSILEMTKAEIREEKARKKCSDETLAQYNKDLKRKDLKSRTHIMTRRERSFTVNAKGQYIRSIPTRTTLKRHQTFHFTHNEALPPPVSGCSCSICQSVQSLGAMALSGGEHHTQGIAKSGQQILLQDKVVVKGQNTGSVKYIGRLEDNPVLGTYIGVELDAPVGANDGTYKKKRYFECRNHHGVFVRPHDILCVTQRKPMFATSIGPQRKLPAPIKRDPSGSTKSTPQHVFLYKHKETLSSVDPVDQVDRELLKIANQEEMSQYQGSVASMSRRWKALKDKNVLKTISPPPPVPASQHEHVQESKLKEEPEHVPEPVPEAEPKEVSESAAVQEPEKEPQLESTTVTDRNESPKEQVAAEDPLYRLLEEELQKKDLGSTGFVTGGEIFSALTSPPINSHVKIADSELVTFLETLGIEKNDNTGVGVPYHELIPQLVSTFSAD